MSDSTFFALLSDFASSLLRQPRFPRLLNYALDCLLKLSPPVSKLLNASPSHPALSHPKFKLLSLAQLDDLQRSAIIQALVNVAAQNPSNSSLQLSILQLMTRWSERGAGEEVHSSRRAPRNPAAKQYLLQSQSAPARIFSCIDQYSLFSSPIQAFAAATQTAPAAAPADILLYRGLCITNITAAEASELPAILQRLHSAGIPSALASEVTQHSARIPLPKYAESETGHALIRSLPPFTAAVKGLTGFLVRANKDYPATVQAILATNVVERLVERLSFVQSPAFAGISLNPEYSAVLQAFVRAVVEFLARLSSLPLPNPPSVFQQDAVRCDLVATLFRISDFHSRDSSLLADVKSVLSVLIQPDDMRDALNRLYMGKWSPDNKGSATAFGEGLAASSHSPGRLSMSLQQQFGTSPMSDLSGFLLLDSNIDFFLEMNGIPWLIHSLQAIIQQVAASKSSGSAPESLFHHFDALFSVLKLLERLLFQPKSNVLLALLNSPFLSLIASFLSQSIDEKLFSLAETCIFLVSRLIHAVNALDPQKSSDNEEIHRQFGIQMTENSIIPLIMRVLKEFMKNNSNTNGIETAVFASSLLEFTLSIADSELQSIKDSLFTESAIPLLCPLLIQTGLKNYRVDTSLEARFIPLLGELDSILPHEFQELQQYFVLNLVGQIMDHDVPSGPVSPRGEEKKMDFQGDSRGNGMDSRVPVDALLIERCLDALDELANGEPRLVMSLTAALTELEDNEDENLAEKARKLLRKMAAHRKSIHKRATMVQQGVIQEDEELITIEDENPYELKPPQAEPQVLPKVHPSSRISMVNLRMSIAERPPAPTEAIEWIQESEWEAEQAKIREQTRKAKEEAFERELAMIEKRKKEYQEQKRLFEEFKRANEADMSSAREKEAEERERKAREEAEILLKQYKKREAEMMQKYLLAEEEDRKIREIHLIPPPPPLPEPEKPVILAIERTKERKPAPLPKEIREMLEKGIVVTKHSKNFSKKITIFLVGRSEDLAWNNGDKRLPYLVPQKHRLGWDRVIRIAVGRTTEILKKKSLLGRSVIPEDRALAIYARVVGGSNEVKTYNFEIANKAQCVQLVEAFNILLDWTREVHKLTNFAVKIDPNSPNIPLPPVYSPEDERRASFIPPPPPED